MLLADGVVHVLTKYLHSFLHSSSVLSRTNSVLVHVAEVQQHATIKLRMTEDALRQSVRTQINSLSENYDHIYASMFDTVFSTVLVSRENACARD